MKKIVKLMPLAYFLSGMTITAHADEIADLIEQLSHSKTSSYADSPTFNQDANGQFFQSYRYASNIKPEHISIVYQAEQTSTPAAAEVLKQARVMTLDNKEIIKGSCWDYLNAVFGRAMVNKEKVFVGQYPKGPFIDTNHIQPGDWLYFVNHSYYDGEHSGLFVGWVDAFSNKALILSYAGENRREPARYKVYDISHTYTVMRPKMI